MDISIIFQFLKELAANNNREWFQAHKEEYLRAQAEFEQLLTAVIARISLFDDSVRGIEAKDCTFRQIRLLIKYISVAISMPMARSRTIVAIIFIWKMETACLREEAFVLILKY